VTDTDRDPASGGTMSSEGALSGGAPVIPIEPPKGWMSVDLPEVWRYRELAYFFVWRDIKVRYKQSVLGIGWAVVQPLLMMVVFTVLMSRIAGIKTGEVPYPIFSFCALVPWTFFANGLSSAANSLLGGGHMISKVYFPRLIVPAAAVFARLVDFAIAGLVLLGMALAYRLYPGWSLAMVVPLTALTILLALGLGLWLSALNIKYRDVRQAVGFFIRLWMFATPVVYPLSKVPERWRWAMALNPMTGVIEGFRSAFLGAPMPWDLVGASLLIGALIFVTGVHYFKRTEWAFADVI